MSSIRVRIAPSPTGYIHIGTLHTALFNYFFAKQNNGQFIIRIEDTDQKRFVPGALESLLRTMKSLGLEHDEGPILNDDDSLGEKGSYGPYIQSKRLETYKEHLSKLLETGHAYYCFCTAERLEAMRQEQELAKKTPKYDRLCLSLGREEIEQRLQTEKFVVRMKVPDGVTVFTDAIRGKISIAHKDLDDQVLLKSDGFPTYHLAVVIDDYLMKISHVIRGEEWLPSTPKHLLLYQMFGWAPPVFAHVPLLLNPDKKKLSKRQGDVAVEDFLKAGYLTDALLNFVGTLGFNPKSDQEIYQLTDLISSFDLSKVNKSGAVMNREKLNWMNRFYLSQMNQDDLFMAAQPFLSPEDKSNNRTARALFIERQRVDRLSDFSVNIRPYLVYEVAKKEILVWKKSDSADATKQLTNIRLFISELSEKIIEDKDLIEEAIKRYITNNGLENGHVLWPLRVALSGLEKSASPFEFIWVLGKEESLKRIDLALLELKS